MQQQAIQNNCEYFYKPYNGKNGPPVIIHVSSNNNYYIPIIVQNKEVWKRTCTDEYIIEEQVFSTCNEEIYEDYLLNLDIERLCAELSCRK
jgi:hypothetical protein